MAVPVPPKIVREFERDYDVVVTNWRNSHNFTPYTDHLTCFGKIKDNDFPNNHNIVQIMFELSSTSNCFDCLLTHVFIDEKSNLIRFFGVNQGSYKDEVIQDYVEHIYKMLKDDYQFSNELKRDLSVNLDKGDIIDL